MSESLAQGDSGQLFPFFEDRGVERFPGDRAAVEGREIIGLYILPDKEPEDSRGSAEGVDTVFFHHSQQIGGYELVEIIYEDVCSAYPLAVELSPDGFPPSGIGQGQMEVPRSQVMPEAGRHYMAQRIGEIVGHHLGFSGGAGSEVNQHHIGIVVDLFRTSERGSGFDAGIEVKPSGGNTRSGRDAPLHRGTMRHRFIDVADNILVAGGENHLYIGFVATVFYILGCQQMGGRNSDRTEFMEPHHCEPELIMPLENKHHPGAAADSEALEI